jgi:hypothetical protein
LCQANHFAATMTEQQITDGWREANIARVLAEMKRYGLSLADLAEADTMPAMVNQTQTQILPATGYKVAGE